MIEIGAAFIHGPSQKNPVFCLARDYNLLDAKALTPENQAAQVDEYPPQVPNWFGSSGDKTTKKPHHQPPLMSLLIKLFISDKHCF